jgi:nucleolar protein 56
MNARTPTDPAWFAGLDPEDVEEAETRIRDGQAAGPADWPRRAVEAGFAEDETQYYDRLREATIGAARAEARRRESADDRQLAHAIGALDDCQRTSNELAERVAEWAGTHDENARVEMSYVRELAANGNGDPVEERIASLATRATELADEAEALREFVERSAPDVAPNLSAIAGPVLAARLVALAGGLEALAKKPSGTVQVLGAEDALFAHLRGGAPSPKHGVIYTHEAVRGTRPEQRGSAARALAGKLAIAARIDHYSGDYRPELEADLAERIERVRARDGA